MVGDPIQFGLGQLDRLMGFFPRNDGKATFLFTLNAGLLSFVAVNFPYREPFSLLAAFALLVLTPASLSMAHLARVFFPHLRGGETNSVLYFGDIARGSSANYADRLRTLTEGDLLEDIACQIHRNAQILDQKFKHVSEAFKLSALSLLPLLSFLIVTALSGHLVWGH